MLRYKDKQITWLVIFIFLFSLFAGTGIFTPRTSFAYHDPESGDQGHTGSTQEPPKNTKPPCEVNRFSCSPVHPRTGNFFYSHQDLFIPGRGFSLQVTRNYDSHDFYDGPFGHGWKFNLEVKLIETTDESGEHVTIRRSSGVRVIFSRNSDGTYSPPSGRHDTLTKNADGTFTWCESGCLTCGGNCYHFDSSGYLTKILDTNNNQMSFSYDGAGKLTQVTDTSGRQLTITYGSNNKISTITDPANRTFAYGYDSEGNLISYTDPLGNTTTYAYDTKHKLTSITDPSGNAVIALTYDDNDRMKAYSGYQGTWTYSYDPENNITYRDDPEGNRWTITYSDTGQLLTVKDPYNNTTTYDWDDNINLISVKDPRGYTTTFTYDANGNRVSETDAFGNTTTYTYDTTHNTVSSVTDPLDHVTRYEYNNDGNVTKIVRDYGGTLENETIFTYDSKGKLASFTDPLGNTTTFTYDSYGNMTQLTDALGNTTMFTYDILGNKLTETDPLGNTTTFSYDSLNRIIAKTDSLSNTTTFTYNTSGTLSNIKGPLGNIKAYTYDSYNRLVQITDQLGNTTQYTYDSMGNRIGVTDGNGNTTIYAYDALNRLISETNALGDTVSYAYDGNGNILAITDPKGSITTYSYDALNRITKTTYPDNTFESFTYDANGNIISRTDRNANTTNYTFDDLQMLVSITYPDATEVSYSYDLNGNIVAASNPAVSYTFSYDAQNRMTQMTNDTIGKSVSYSYLWSDLKSSMTNPEGGVTTYTYDAIKRLTSLANHYGETTSYAYDNLSRIIRKDLSNGTYTTFAYDAANRLTGLVNKTPGESTISSYTYTYDNIYNRMSMTTLEGTHNYSYDEIYQLLQASHPASFTETYTYDSVHNRLTSSDHNDWTYDSNNRLLSYDNMSFTYDSNGNMITKTDTVSSEVTNYQYDYENRLKRIDYPDGTYSEYHYDPFGNRVKKDVNGTVTYFLYDFTKRLPDMIAEYNGSGSLVVNYTHGPRVDEVISIRRDGNSYFYLKDGLGSITSLNDSMNTTVNTYEYDAFGNVINKTGSVNNPYGYTGRMPDNESGLLFYRARYYDPVIGRFIHADPIGFSGGINFYAYVANNPINKIDPWGLRGFWENLNAILENTARGNTDEVMRIRERMGDIEEIKFDAFWESGPEAVVEGAPAPGGWIISVSNTFWEYYQGAKSGAKAALETLINLLPLGSGVTRANPLIREGVQVVPSIVTMGSRGTEAVNNANPTGCRIIRDEPVKTETIEAQTYQPETKTGISDEDLDRHLYTYP